jgi:hypothetical protein
MLKAQFALLTKVQSTVDDNANRAATNELENPLDQQAAGLLTIVVHLLSGNKEMGDKAKELLKIFLRIKKRSTEARDSLRRESSDLARAIKAKFPGLGEALLEALHISRAQEEKVYDRFGDQNKRAKKKKNLFV